MHSKMMSTLFLTLSFSLRSFRSSRTNLSRAPGAREDTEEGPGPLEEVAKKPRFWREKQLITKLLENKFQNV